MTGFVSWGFLVLMLSGVSAFTQTQCPADPPAYALLRQDEDYSYLGNPACRKDYWDRFKYVQLGSSADTFVTSGGEIREWYEGYRNANWGYGIQDENGYLLQRVSIYSDIQACMRFIRIQGLGVG